MSSTKEDVNARREAVGLLGALRHEVEALCEPLRHARPIDAQAAAQLLWLIELHAKLEEQWLYPALQDAAPLASVPPALLQIELMRELAHRWEQAPEAGRTMLLPLIDGLAQAHFALVDAVLASAQERRVDWARLHADMAAMLARWREEVRDSGDIENEEADPVGRPPR